MATETDEVATWPAENVGAATEIGRGAADCGLVVAAPGRAQLPVEPYAAPA